MLIAYHSAQGPIIDVPQMIQSDAQFGFYDFLLPGGIVISMHIGSDGRAVPMLTEWGADGGLGLLTGRGSVAPGDERMADTERYARRGAPTTGRSGARAR